MQAAVVGASMATLRIQFHALVTSARRTVAGRSRQGENPTCLCRVQYASGTSSIEGADAVAVAAAVLDPEDGGVGSMGQEMEPVRQPSKSYFPKKGQDLELICESLAFKGKGVCKVADTGFVVLCERALPGERLIARITERQRGFAQAYKLKTLSPHHNAVDAPCQYFGNCGGCKTQNLAYSAQLQAKHEQVQELIIRVGRFELGPDESPDTPYVKPIVPCQDQYHYRNKMEFSFGTEEWIPEDSFQKSPPTNVRVWKKEKKGNSDVTTRGFALGLHAPRRFDKIISIKRCLLQQEIANEVLASVHAYCQGHLDEMPAYDEQIKDGFLRHLLIRSGRNFETGELQLMVVIVTKEHKPKVLEPFVAQMVATFPQVVSVINNVNSSLGNTSFGEQEYLLHGSSRITETLCGLVFEISSSSFFQPNPVQAEVLYKLVEDACMLRGDGSEILLDLFCGTGTIGLTMAKKVKHVYGYELVPEAVADARRNAKRNGIENATFVEGDLNKLTSDFGKDLPQPDVVVIDPNRPGLHTKLVKFLLKLRTPRIVYVSCNPATLARDLDILCHGDTNLGIVGSYRLASVVPVDMFPHTPHTECVSILELQSS